MKHTIILFFIFYLSTAYAQLGTQDSITWLLDSTQDQTYQYQYECEQKALQLARQANLVEQETQALLEMATTLSYIGDHLSSLEHFAQAKQLLDKHHFKNLKKEYYLKKSGVLARLEHYKEAIAFNEEAIEWFTQQKDTINTGLSYGNLGALHYKLRNMEMAEQCFQKALKTLENTSRANDGMILTNLANLYVYKGREAKAIPYYEQYLETVRANKSKIHEVSVLTNLAFAYGMNGNYQKSLKLFDEALQLAKAEKLPDAEYEALRLLSYIHEKEGNLKEALETYIEYQEIREEVIGQQTQEQIAEWRVKYEMEQKDKALALNKERLLNLQQESTIRRQQYLLISGGFVLLFIIGVLIYLKRASDFKKNKELYLMEQELMESELKNKELEQQQLQEQLEHQTKDLTSLTLDITRKNEFSDQLLSKINALDKHLPPEAKQQLLDLRQFVVSNLRINEEMEVFQKSIETINQSFYQRLLEQFPHLTTKDTELCGLIKLNRTNKEIATIKNISANSAKMSRYRLRKKLGLKPDENIVHFLRDFS